MSRTGAKPKGNRRSRRQMMMEKAGCSVSGCQRRGAYKVDLENGSSVVLCRKHYSKATAKGLIKITEETKF